jgi:hypothetical protein
MRVSIRRLLGHRPIDHRLQESGDRKVGLHSGQRRNRLGDVRLHDAFGGVGHVRQPSCQQLEQDHPRRVDVRPRVHAFRLGLLGGHVRGRSEDDPDERRILGRARRARALEELRHPKVENPDVIGLAGQRLQEDVRGREIAVNDPLAVGEVQPAQRLADDVERAPRRHGPFVDQIRQRLPLEELHHQVRHTAVDPKVGDRDDVGVRRRRERPRLALETATPLGRRGRALLQHLDRHQPIELDVPALVDHADAADAQARQHLIASAQGPTDERISYGLRWEQVYPHKLSLYIPGGPRRHPSAVRGKT